MHQYSLIFVVQLYFFLFLMQGLVKPRLALEFALWQAMIFLPLLRIRTKFFLYLLIRGQRTTYQSFFFFFNHMGPGNQIQIARLGSKRLPSWTMLSDLNSFLFFSFLSTLILQKANFAKNFQLGLYTSNYTQNQYPTPATSFVLRFLGLWNIFIPRIDGLIPKGLLYYGLLMKDILLLVLDRCCSLISWAYAYSWMSALNPEFISLSNLVVTLNIVFKNFHVYNACTMCVLLVDYQGQEGSNY